MGRRDLAPTPPSPGLSTTLTRALTDPALWALGLLALLCLLPVLVLLAGSLVGESGALSFERYGAVLDSARSWKNLGRSIASAGIGVLVACALGVPYALIVSRWALRGRRVLLVLGALPLMIPLHVHTMAWLDLVAASEAISDVLTEAKGFAAAAYAAGAIQGLALMPLVALFAAAALSSADADLEEAARLDGTRWQVFWSVTLPAAAPGIGGGAVVVFCVTLLGYEVPGILGADAYAFEVFTRFDRSWNHGDAAATSAPLIVLAGVLALGGWWFLRRRAIFDVSVVWAPGRLRAVRGPTKAVGISCLVGVLALTAGVPLLALVRGTGLDPEALRFALVGEGAALGRSVCLSTAVALVASLLCWPVGYRIVRTRGLWRMAWGVVLLPLVCSPALVGIALILVFNRGGPLGWVYGSPAILVIGGLSRLAPVALLAAAAAAARVPRQLEEAAGVDGASRAQVFVRIVLPLSAGGMVAGSVAVFVLMMGETGVSFLVKPAGWWTYPIVFMDLVHFGQVGRLSALALAQLAVCAIPVLAGAALLLRREPE